MTVAVIGTGCVDLFCGTWFSEDMKSLVVTGARSGVDLHVLRAAKAVSEPPKPAVVAKGIKHHSIGRGAE